MGAGVAPPDGEHLLRVDDARIDPRGLVRFFRRIDADGRAATLLPTHPAAAKRVVTLETAIAQRPPVVSVPLGGVWRPGTGVPD